MNRPKPKRCKGLIYHRSIPFYGLVKVKQAFADKVVVKNPLLANALPLAVVD